MTRLVLRITMLLLASGTAFSQSRIDLLDPGAEPRAPIRYQYKAGHSENTALQVSTSLTREVEGKPVPLMNIPSVRMTLAMRVAEVAADGSARLEFEIRSTEAAIDQAGGTVSQAMLADALAGASRLAGWYRADTRGQITTGDLSMKPGSGTPSPMQSMLEMALSHANDSIRDTAAIFPEQAVGPGARWNVVSTTQAGELTVSTTQEFTLRSRDGNRVELDLRATNQSSLPQDGASGLKMTSQGGSPTMRGSMIVELDRLTPATTLTVDHLTGAMGAPSRQPATMPLRMQMKITLAPEAN